MGKYNYWGATDEIMAEGNTPTCPHCGEKMFPEDDHGRFTCFCRGIGRTTVDGRNGALLPSPRPIPQVDTTSMTDEEKAKIPPVHRLHDTPTAEEAATFKNMFQEVQEAMGVKISVRKKE